MFDMSDTKKEKESGAVAGISRGLTQTGSNINMLNNPDILTGVSHEMRTHMNAIVAFSFLMNKNESNDEERKEFSDYIINSCDQLIVLFDNFLDSAIIDAGNSVNDFRKCNINDFLNDQLSDFRSYIKKHNHKSVDLILDDKCVNPGNILIDIDKVSRVIRNLFLNALNSTNSGYIRIGYNFDSGKLTFYILDSGQGFHKTSNLLGSLNGINYDGGSSDTQAAVSFILAKKLVSLMQGELWIEKNGFSGTGVYFSIPVKTIAETSRSAQETEFRTRMAI
jgi:signal transduction histidine kinase